ncbi:MAG: trans-2-enoyl-CoA reductase family protein [Dehalococcoidia bacterium]|nr:trans-2-enoyl-CoA reductase family protein [Dehalococcoidia bacterium]
MAKIIVEPRMRGFISLTAHPDGCANRVLKDIEIAKDFAFPEQQKNVLVIGSSQGYGLSSLLTSCFGYNNKTLGICFEKPPSASKTATAGWYNLVEAHRQADEESRDLYTINGDAFSQQVKNTASNFIKENFGQIDLLIYSLAAPRRVDPEGNIWNSTLKPIGDPYQGYTFNLRNHSIANAELEPATQDEITHTVKVMGGEDWKDWVEFLKKGDLLSDQFRTVAYSYIGPEVSAAIYRDGTIGQAKKHLESTAKEMNELFANNDGGAWVSINTAVVTQASSAIPAVPLYMSILFKIMKERNTHEKTIHQIGRLFRDYLRSNITPKTDADNLIRLDDFEMLDEVQKIVSEIWSRVSNDTLYELTDYKGYREEFEQLFGFNIAGIDYTIPTEIERELQLVDIET